MKIKEEESDEDNNNNNNNNNKDTGCPAQLNIANAVLPLKKRIHYATQDHELF